MDSHPDDPKGVHSGVNITQSIRSPIWSVPTVSEGQLNVGGGTTSPDTSTSMDTSGSPHTSPTGSGARRVVVKQIAPKQRQPPSLPSTRAPAMASLAQLWSTLTPDQAQDLLRTLQQHQQQSSVQAPAGVSRMQQPHQAGYGSVLTHPARMTGSKPLMPKTPGALSLQRRGGASAFGVRGTVASGVQKIVAPVAVPPTAPRPGSDSGAPAPYQSLDVLKEPPPPPAPSSVHTHPSHQPVITTSKPRKPCNCKNSQCLKLYCDCFANGEFCREGCHCLNCKNNMKHAEERARAVKTCLDRNPHAFKPKVGQNKAGDERRHIKGCNCKRSGCLKNYCECYEAKIPCSNMCRCVGCKNLPEKPENKSLMHLADAADIRTQQHMAASSHFMEQLELTSSRPQATSLDGQRLPFSFINKEVAKATCLCLLEEASHAVMNGKSFENVECAVLEEFGRCMKQIISSAQSASEEGNRRRIMAVQ